MVDAAMAGARDTAAWILLALSCGAQDPFGPQLPPPPPRIELSGLRALSGDRFIASDGVPIAISGIQAPEPGDDGTVVTFLGDAARRRLDELVRERRLAVVHSPHDLLDDGTRLARVLLQDGRSLAVVMISEGLARPAPIATRDEDRDAIDSAWRSAREARRGLHGREPAPRSTAVEAFHDGISLGLYAQDDAYDYRPFLDQIRDLGASHLMLIVPRFLEDWRSTRLEAVRGRTASFAAVTRVSRQARERGLLLTFMPIVLLRTGTGDHWRGDIAPSNRLEWFRNYGRHLGHWADIAADCGASMLVVGSELSSMEKDEDRWRALIHGIRLRFSGMLSYSANWDHLTTIRFWDALDLVGMTGYHSLTAKDDPTRSEIVAAWRPIRDRILALHRETGRPFVFTELGYASQDGINKDPWNYLMSKIPDWEEQADCYRAFFEVWSGSPPGYRGAYFYNWWQNLDPDDRLNYSIRGKPAEAVIRDAFRRRRTPR
jgi:endonuclease YncB( thermonuclease family)